MRSWINAVFWWFNLLGRWTNFGFFYHVERDNLYSSGCRRNWQELFCCTTSRVFFSSNGDALFLLEWRRQNQKSSVRSQPSWSHNHGRYRLARRHSVDRMFGALSVSIGSWQLESSATSLVSWRWDGPSHLAALLCRSFSTRFYKIEVSTLLVTTQIVLRTRGKHIGN